MRPWEGSKGLVVVVGRSWRIQTPVVPQIYRPGHIWTQIVETLWAVIVIEPVVERAPWFQTLVMTKQARLENSLLLILKRGSWTTWCRKVKICWRLSGEGNRWEWRRRGRLTRPGGPDQNIIGFAIGFGQIWEDPPDKIVQELICRKGGESVVHHPCNQIPQLVSEWVGAFMLFPIYLILPDCWFDLLQHLLTMIIEELVDGVGQQLILPVKQVVHVDYHLEVNSILKLLKS